MLREHPVLFSQQRPGHFQDNGHGELLLAVRDSRDLILHALAAVGHLDLSTVAELHKLARVFTQQLNAAEHQENGTPLEGPLLVSWNPTPDLQEFVQLNQILFAAPVVPASDTMTPADCQASPGISVLTPDQATDLCFGVNNLTHTEIKQERKPVDRQPHPHPNARGGCSASSISLKQERDVPSRTQPVLRAARKATALFHRAATVLRRKPLKPTSSSLAAETKTLDPVPGGVSCPNNSHSAVQENGPTEVVPKRFSSLSSLVPSSKFSRQSSTKGFSRFFSSKSMSVASTITNSFDDRRLSPDGMQEEQHVPQNEHVCQSESPTALRYRPLVFWL